MKKICILILILLSVLACKKEETVVEETVIPDQLLGDTDAELLASQFWNSYQVSSTSGQILTGAITTHGFTIGRIENVSRSPIHSFMISRTTINSEYFAYYSQRYPRQMPVGKNLTLRAYIKGVNLEGEGASLMIECEDVNLAHVQVADTRGSVSIKGTFDWTAYTVELKNLGSNVTTIFVYLNYLPNTTGTVYFDDITLTQAQ
jgi:hypothetical protein